jgi:hypothetical protein
VVSSDIDKVLQNWDISNNIESSSIVDQVKEVAESVLLQSGFVYEQTSGMYYDYNTGYYYDTVCIIMLNKYRETLYGIHYVLLFIETKKIIRANLF